MLSLEIPIPIYFSHETSELLEIYESLKSSADSDGSGTATSGNYRKLLSLKLIIKIYDH